MSLGKCSLRCFGKECLQSSPENLPALVFFPRFLGCEFTESRTSVLNSCSGRTVCCPCSCRIWWNTAAKSASAIMDSFREASSSALGNSAKVYEERVPVTSICRQWISPLPHFLLPQKMPTNLFSKELKNQRIKCPKISNNSPLISHGKITIVTDGASIAQWSPGLC